MTAPQPITQCAADAEQTIHHCVGFVLQVWALLGPKGSESGKTIQVGTGEGSNDWLAQQRSCRPAEFCAGAGYCGLLTAFTGHKSACSGAASRAQAIDSGSQKNGCLNSTLYGRQAPTLWQHLCCSDICGVDVVITPGLREPCGLA